MRDSRDVTLVNSDHSFRFTSIIDLLTSDCERGWRARGWGPRMSVSSGGSPSNLDDRIERLLQHVDYRRADTAEERAAIYRLRYSAYLREGAIAPNVSEQFSDP